jgi:ABC-type cobalamin/Fe3+-siderophores transport system ATPase subunit
VGEKILATNLSFIARDGELTCITGPEGSGKTAFIRTLMGFLPVKAGFVSVDGELLTVRSSHAFRKMMVYLPQTLQMLGHQLEEVAPEEPEEADYAVWDALLPKRAVVEAPAPLSSEAICQLAEKTIREAPDKPIIVADEPTALLTPEDTERLISLLKAQAAAGKTVLVASRKYQVISRADQVITLENDKS